MRVVSRPLTRNCGLLVLPHSSAEITKAPSIQRCGMRSSCVDGCLRGRMGSKQLECMRRLKRASRRANGRRRDRMASAAANSRAAPNSRATRTTSSADRPNGSAQLQTISTSRWSRQQNAPPPTRFDCAGVQQQSRHFQQDPGRSVRSLARPPAYYCETHPLCCYARSTSCRNEPRTVRLITVCVASLVDCCRWCRLLPSSARRSSRRR